MIADAFWYVQINGANYGPYSDANIKDFIIEGRLTPNSLITADQSRGFYPVSVYPQFNQPHVHAAQYPQHSEPLFGKSAPLMLNQPLQPVQTPVSPPQRQHDIPSTPPISSLTPPDIIPESPLSSDTLNSDQETVLMIVAEIRSENPMRFLTQLQAMGTAERIADTVWLLRGTNTVQSARNHLSQTLSKQDRLFILDSLKNETAWFNIGAELDRRIRGLWDFS